MNDHEKDHARRYVNESVRQNLVFPLKELEKVFAKQSLLQKRADQKKHYQFHSAAAIPDLAIARSE